MFHNFNFDYDSEQDSLFIYNPKFKSKASVEIEDIIIDFNSNKEISAIELLDASEFLSNLDLDENIDIKELLRTIKECKLDIITKDNFFVIKFVLISKSNKKITTPLLIPTINNPSPALAEIMN